MIPVSAGIVSCIFFFPGDPPAIATSAVPDVTPVVYSMFMEAGDIKGNYESARDDFRHAVTDWIEALPPSAPESDKQELNDVVELLDASRGVDANQAIHEAKLALLAIWRKHHDYSKIQWNGRLSEQALAKLRAEYKVAFEEFETNLGNLEAALNSESPASSTEQHDFAFKVCVASRRYWFLVALGVYCNESFIAADELARMATRQKDAYVLTEKVAKGAESLANKATKSLESRLETYAASNKGRWRYLEELANGRPHVGRTFLADKIRERETEILN